ncbi:hypothetical protein SKAU_G00135760 [Synaphobranchus kaupii]|uniref:Transposase n=1 Tax=Synaphobranchus kaupii TaxID=118154 RepID=A0A9Q1J3X8_SYNKA|nr:hypothetical protein SKAU_G00135760 [Synaphobranchus kaupii]
MQREQMKTLSDAIQQIKTDMMAYFDTKAATILSTLNCIENSFSTLGDQVVQLEQRLQRMRTTSCRRPRHARIYVPSDPTASGSRELHCSAAYRAGSPHSYCRNHERASPRSILIKLLHFQDKVKILRLARVKKELIFNGNHIFIYSADLTKRRRSFDPVKRRLRELNLKFSLRYPCTLSVWVDGKEQQFTDHKAAEDTFISFRNSSMSSPP